MSITASFKPLTITDYENFGVRPNPLVLAMDGFVAKKELEAKSPPVLPVKKYHGLDLLNEYRDKAVALGGPKELASEMFRKVAASALWQGFKHAWVKRPHRLSEQASRLSDVSYDRATDSVSYEHTSSFRVGAYADIGEVLVQSTVLKGNGLSFYQGRVDESRLTVSDELGKEGIVRIHERIDLDQAGIANRDQITVVLSGFSLRCLDYAGGYNTRGYGVRVIPIGMKDGVYEFDVEFRIHPEHAPDRPQPDDYYVGAPLPDGTYPMLSLGGHALAYLKWAWGRVGKLTGLWSPPPMKGNLDDYAYAAQVDYLVVGADSAKASITEARENPSNAYGQKANLSWRRRTIPPVDPAIQQASIAGHPGYAHGVAGIQGFNWHLENWDPTRKDGRYIRELEVRLGDADYDPATGRMSVATLIGFSNASPFPEGFDARYAMWASLLQFGDNVTPAPVAIARRGTLDENAHARERSQYVWNS